ncbi:formin-like protein 20 [Panicum virgatum]|uniref:formin-like protein 20 n=1 Tax=Panicum virgatum TaxID=38727 RepID=UPI0019D69B4A|nr:formin-like protein 20 [Panicum virgatum]
MANEPLQDWNEIGIWETRNSCCSASFFHAPPSSCSLDSHGGTPCFPAAGTKRRRSHGGASPLWIPDVVEPRRCGGPHRCGVPALPAWRSAAPPWRSPAPISWSPAPGSPAPPWILAAVESPRRQRGGPQHRHGGSLPAMEIPRPAAVDLRRRGDPPSRRRGGRRPPPWPPPLRSQGTVTGRRVP